MHGVLFPLTSTCVRMHTPVYTQVSHKKNWVGVFCFCCFYPLFWFFLEGGR